MNDNINLPPFFVSQRVVALVNGYLQKYKKGDEFVILGVRKSCCEWEVDIGIFAPTTFMICSFCDRQELTSIWWLSAKDFAPIEETFQSISLEKVLELETPLIGVN